MKTVTKIILFNLVVILALLFVYPEFMISPGALKTGHAEIHTDCFACHTPLLGASSARCIECHKVEEIGRLTTTGKSIAKPKTKVAFHQELLEQDCVACHSDHRGVETYRTARRFSHGLLEPAMRELCAECHNAPEDRIHRKLGDDCRQCHNNERWSPASFEHTHLAPAKLEQCAGCHARPEDALHRKVGERCGQCHETERWSPASFDHRNYFRLDRDHDTQCATCHEGNDYSRYTCYGCHEHSPWNVHGEHLEEGIRDFENCTECHRSADEDEAEWRMHNRGRANLPAYRSERYWGREHDDDDDDHDDD